MSSNSLPSSPTLRIYPNPVSSNGILYIEGDPLKAGDKIEIFDMQGTLLSTKTASEAKTSIRIGALSGGTYLLRLAGQTGVKFIVK